jgi:voltage-gated potassium channel
VTPTTPVPSTSERLRGAEVLAKRLDKPMGLLGIVFLFVVLGQVVVSEPRWSLVFTVLGWVFWAVFVAEFLLRAYIAGFQREFWKQNWWQVIFLLVPFLRFVRALQALRLARIVRVTRFGGILSAGVRGSRSASRLLSSRIGWLAALTAVVILAASQLLYTFGSPSSYADALYTAALATVNGGGIDADDAFSRILHVVLSVYSVAVFATLAGSLGAFFLRGQAPLAPEPGGSHSDQ